jgi:hypothetical protein
VVQRWGHPYLPVQDQAVLDLRVRDVWSFSANTPLTGPYSRFGWDHPGPLLYYLLALFSGVTGEPAWATLVGNALLQGVAIAWIGRLSWKAGGLRWQIPFLAVVAMSYWATGPWILQQVWNPHVVFPFFALFLLQSWLVARGEPDRLLGYVFVASFLVESHIGYALLVVIIGSWSVARLVISEQSEGRAARRWSLWRVPAALLAALWFIPVVLDTVLHFPGNAARLVSFYAGLGHATVQPLLGARRGLGYLAVEFRWIPPWLGGSDPVDALTGLSQPAPLRWLVGPVVLIGVGWLLARRRRRADLLRLSELLVVTLLAGGVTLALLRGAPTPYLFYWRITIGAATVVLGLCVLVEAALRPTPDAATSGDGSRPDGVPTARWATAALCAVLLAGLAASSVSLTSEVDRADGPISPMAAVVGSFLRQLQREHQPSGPFILRIDGSALGGLQGGLFDALARQGARVYADAELGYQFGYGRVARPGQVRTVWYVTEESDLYALLSREPYARVLAVSHPLASKAERQLVSIERRLAAGLVRHGREDEVPDLGSVYAAYLLGGSAGAPGSELDLLQRLNRRVDDAVCLCSVVAFPSDHLPPPMPS